MTSSFLMELEEECQTCTDGFTAHSLLFCAIMVHSTCHEDKTVRWRKAQTSLPRACSDVRVPCKEVALASASASAALLLGRPVQTGVQTFLP
jgi:hypothetical protein